MTSNNRSGKSESKRMLLMFAAAALMASTGFLGGCGDDTTVSGRRPAQARGGKAKPKAAAGAVKKPGAKGSVQRYNKITEGARRTFLEKDFRPDPKGDGNRNPFRSYLITQPGQESTSQTVNADNDICKNTKKKKNWKAPTYSLRSLTLIGIIMRGTRGYAQFLDRSGEGWIVTQNNCLGAEKAIVTSIGAGVVRLQVQPEAPAGGTAPEPVAQDIPLYPKEFENETADQ